MKRICKKVFPMLLFLWIISEAVSVSGDQKDRKDHTVMIYMIGSNLESRNGSGSKDILEMSTSGIDLSKSNVVICTGGSRRWALDISARQNSVLELTGDENYFQTVLESDENQNMGDGKTLTDFLDYAALTYPAEHYSLIFWDHGSGPVMGFGNDELYEYDSLRLPELKEGLENSIFGDICHLDWIGFDACLMSGIEVAEILADYADYMVASQEVEPGSGWDYSFLEILNETSNPIQIAEKITDCYMGFYEAKKSEMFQPELTLACLDLSRSEEVLKAMDSLFDGMNAELEAGAYSDLARLRREAKGYGFALSTEKGEGPDLIDLGSLGDLTRERLPEQCEMLDQALQAMVTVNAGNVEHSCGVSVYYPYTNKDYYKKAGQTLCRDIFDSEGYRNYMERYTGIWISGNQTADEDWILSETAVEEQELTLLLSDEQLENYASASYTILEKNEDDTFSPVLNSVKIDPDENGVLHVPKEMQLFYLWADGAQTQTVWPVEELNSADQKTYYRTKYTGLYSQSDFFGSENIWVLFYVTPEGETVIQSVEARNESDQPSGKDTMDLEHWHIIGYNEWRYQFRAGPEGEPVSYTEWIPVTGVYEAHLVDFSESISFHRENLKNSSTRYYCQIIVQTTDGKEYASDLTELNPFGVQSTITADTEHGRLRFSRFEDHLELIAYEGEDTVLEIPDEIYGIPVTVIRDQAFRNQASLEEVQMPDCVIQTGERVFMGCTKLAKLRLSEGLTELNGYMFRDCGALTELQIPAQVTRIGAGCFYHCESLTDFEIPEQVTYIGTSAFARCPNLKRLRISSSVSVIQPEAFYNSHQLHLEIDENNTSYGLKDGVLFTSDGKQLLEAPGGVLEEITVYQVPEGTEQIAKGAFMNAQKLTEVRFPEGLLAIEDEAFCFCQQLEAPVFPESLESIGHNAFSRGGYLPSENSWKQIFFGKNFSFLGVNAFQGRRVEKFVTAPENPYYCEVDGMLCAKAKDVLLRVPDAKAPVLRIPEGISSIEAGALETAGNITELILSDSVKTIDQEAGLSMQEQLSGIYLGKDFSDIGILRGCQSLKTLEISRENQKYRTKDGTVYDSDQKVLLFYPIAQEKKVLVVPEGVTEIEAGSFGVRSILSTSGNETLEEIRLPSSLEMIWYFSFQSEGGTFDNLRALKRIQVAEGNQVYQSLDGLLYSGGMTKLQYIPRGIEGTIVLPDTIKEIAANAIGNSGAYSEIVIREGVSRIREGNIFQWFNWNSEKKLKVHLPESLKRIDTVETGTPGQVELYVRAGSFAEQWAKENGYTYYIENSQ